MRDDTIIIRADASIRIGTGHVMRCLALAQAWRDRDGTTLFAMAAGSSPGILERIRSEGMQIHPVSEKPGSLADADATASLAEDLGAGWIVVDGYQFGADYQKRIRDCGESLLVVDDYGHAGHYYADIILNQNGYASPGMYPKREPYTDVLAGPRYALLRREFAAIAGKRRRIPRMAKRLLVTMGGSDPANYTQKIICALHNLPEHSCTTRVVIGGFNPHRRDLVSLVESHPQHDISLLEGVTDMAGLETWADLAVTAGGSTTYELACLGVPMLTICIADNQERNCEYLESAGAAVNLGRPSAALFRELPEILRELMAGHKRRLSLSAHARDLVDGSGAKRVIAHLDAGEILLRKAVPADCWTVYRWAVDPRVREVSFSREDISWDEHMPWFLAKIDDPGVVYYIVTRRDGTPIGQVRFDVDKRDATISITIGAEYRGKHYGSSAIIKASGCLFKTTHVNTIHAFVKKENPASLLAFQRAGYVKTDDVRRGGKPACHLVMKR